MEYWICRRKSEWNFSLLHFQKANERICWLLVAKKKAELRTFLFLIEQRDKCVISFLLLIQLFLLSAFCVRLSNSIKFIQFKCSFFPFERMIALFVCIFEWTFVFTSIEMKSMFQSTLLAHFNHFFVWSRLNLMKRLNYTCWSNIGAENHANLFVSIFRFQLQRILQNHLITEFYFAYNCILVTRSVRQHRKCNRKQLFLNNISWRLAQYCWLQPNEKLLSNWKYKRNPSDWNLSKWLFNQAKHKNAFNELKRENKNRFFLFLVCFSKLFFMKLFNRFVLFLLGPSIHHKRTAKTVHSRHRAVHVQRQVHCHRHDKVQQHRIHHSVVCRPVKCRYVMCNKVHTEVYHFERIRTLECLKYHNKLNIIEMRPLSPYQTVYQYHNVRWPFQSIQSIMSEALVDQIHQVDPDYHYCMQPNIWQIDHNNHHPIKVDRQPLKRFA